MCIIVTMKEQKTTYCDLHTHSVYSDGTYTPAELIEKAEQLGLSAVALTDHNTVAGLAEFAQAAKGKRVQAVAGIEISTDYGDRELHILGLFIKPDTYARLMPPIEEMLSRREQSNLLLLENLHKADFEISYEEVKNRTQAKSFNRAHVAAVMVEKGYADSIAEAFDRYLAVGKGFYFGPKRLDVFETIAFLKELGAVAVLAHPFLQFNEKELRVFLGKAKAYGLDGMETMYSAYTAETTKKAQAIAAEFGLKESGGSDFHGENRPGIALGSGRGDIQVPTAVFDKLKA